MISLKKFWNWNILIKMNKNPENKQANKDITFILTGKYPKTFMDEYREKQKKILKEIFK